MNRNFKLGLLVLLVLLFSVMSIGTAFAQDTYLATDPNEPLEFEWDYSEPEVTVPPDLAGFRLYMSNTAGVYTLGEGNEIASSPNNVFTITIPAVEEGTYYFVVTAFDTSGNESEKSNEVELEVDYTAPPAPVNLRCLKLKIIIKID